MTKEKSNGVGSLMKDIWNTDLAQQRKEFTQDQASNSKLLAICQEKFFM